MGTGAQLAILRNRTRGRLNMHGPIRLITRGWCSLLVMLPLAACVARPSMMGPHGTGWGTGAFGSNGERIYFTGTSDRGTAITYTGGPASGSWMMGSGQLTCASCHGPGGKGGRHNMGMMQVMDAKDIRWSILQHEFDATAFGFAVRQGQDPDGTQLGKDMPRWNIGDEDLADVIAFLKTFP